MPDLMDGAGDAVRFDLPPNLKNRFRSAIELFLLWIMLASSVATRLSPDTLGRLSVDALEEQLDLFFFLVN